METDENGHAIDSLFRFHFASHEGDGNYCFVRERGLALPSNHRRINNTEQASVLNAVFPDALAFDE